MSDILEGTVFQVGYGLTEVAEAAGLLDLDIDESKDDDCDGELEAAEGG